MQPAFKVPLSAKELEVLGEIAVIQGQIEYLITEATAKVLEIPYEAAEKIYGPVPLTRRMSVFALFALRVQDPPDFAARVNDVLEDLRPLVEKRNDFLHAVFGLTYDGIGKGRVMQATNATGTRVLTTYTNAEVPPFRFVGDEPKQMKPTSFRTANSQRRAYPDELQALRGALAAISHRVGYLWHSLDPHMRRESPWREGQ